MAEIVLNLCKQFREFEMILTIEEFEEEPREIRGGGVTARQYCYNVLSDCGRVEMHVSMQNRDLRDDEIKMWQTIKEELDGLNTGCSMIATKALLEQLIVQWTKTIEHLHQTHPSYCSVHPASFVRDLKELLHKTTSL